MRFDPVLVVTFVRPEDAWQGNREQMTRCVLELAVGESDKEGRGERTCGFMSCEDKHERGEGEEEEGNLQQETQEYLRSDAVPKGNRVS